MCAIRTSIFSLIDRLVILSDGKSLYCGPTSTVIPYFTANGFLFPQTCNPLDLLVDLTTIDFHSSGSAAQSRARVAQLAARWALHRRIEISRRSTGKASPLARDAPGRAVVVPSEPLFASRGSRTPRGHCGSVYFALGSLLVACWNHPRARQGKLLLLQKGPILWLRNWYLLLHRSVLHKCRRASLVAAELLVGLCLSSLVVVVFAVSRRTSVGGWEGCDGASSAFWGDQRRKTAVLFLLVLLQVLPRHATALALIYLLLTA